MFRETLYFEQWIAITFECNFETRYDPITTYKWLVNGMEVQNTGDKHYTRFFYDGNYEVTCIAWYKLPNCSACNRSASLPVEIYSTNTSFLPVEYCGS